MTRNIGLDGVLRDDATLLILPTASIITAPAMTVGKVAAAIASQATTTCPNDGQKHAYEISVSITITTLGSGSINCEVSYTDDSNTAHANCIIPLSTDAGTIVQAAATASSYHGWIPITCQPNTAITILTAGTFTGCTYNFFGAIKQVR